MGLPLEHWCLYAVGIYVLQQINRKYILNALGGSIFQHSVPSLRRPTGMICIACSRHSARSMYTAHMCAGLLSLHLAAALPPYQSPLVNLNGMSSFAQRGEVDSRMCKSREDLHSQPG
jgi:hypothetical protein